MTFKLQRSILHKLFSLGGIFISISLLFALIFLTSFGTYAVQYIQDRNVELIDQTLTVTNLNGTSATIVWTSSEKIEASVVVSNKPFDPGFFTQGGETFYDDRDMTEVEYGVLELDKHRKRDIHHVTIYGLDPETTYYFAPKHGVAAVESSVHSFTTTRIAEEITVPDLLYGRVLHEDKTLMDTAVILVQRTNDTGTRSQILSTYTVEEDQGKGTYTLDVGNLFTEKLDAMYTKSLDDTFEFTYFAQEQEVLLKKPITVKATQVQPVEDVQMIVEEDEVVTAQHNAFMQPVYAQDCPGGSFGACITECRRPITDFQDEENPEQAQSNWNNGCPAACEQRCGQDDNPSSNENDCAPEEWSCNGACADKETRDQFNRIHEDGEAEWLRQAGCSSDNDPDTPSTEQSPRCSQVPWGEPGHYCLGDALINCPSQQSNGHVVKECNDECRQREPGTPDHCIGDSSIADETNPTLGPNAWDNGGCKREDVAFSAEDKQAVDSGQHDCIIANCNNGVISTTLAKAAGCNNQDCSNPIYTSEEEECIIGQRYPTQSLPQACTSYPTCGSGLYCGTNNSVFVEHGTLCITSDSNQITVLVYCLPQGKTPEDFDENGNGSSQTEEPQSDILNDGGGEVGVPVDEASCSISLNCTIQYTNGDKTTETVVREQNVQCEDIDNQELQSEIGSEIANDPNPQSEIGFVRCQITNKQTIPSSNTAPQSHNYYSTPKVLAQSPNETLEPGVYTVEGSTTKEITVTQEGDLRIFADLNGNGVKDGEDEPYLEQENLPEIRVQRVADAIPYQLPKGWVSMGFPLVMNGENGTSNITTADQLINELNNQGANVTQVVKYTHGTFETYSLRKNAEGAFVAFGENFKIANFETENEVGRSVFVRNHDEADVVLTGQLVEGSLPVILESGWNYVNVYHGEKEYTGFEVLRALASKGVNAPYLSIWQSAESRYANMVLQGGIEFGLDRNIDRFGGVWIRIDDPNAIVYEPE